MSQSEGPALLATLQGIEQLSCACFAPNNNFVVAAGTLTGALALWDLRECSSPIMNALDAAYTTSGLSGVSTPIHSSMVLNLCPTPDQSAPLHTNASFQLVSVDDRGLIAIWLVTESLPEHTSLGHSISDVISRSHGTVSHIDESLAGLRNEGMLRLTCSRTFAIWSSLPKFFSPHNCLAQR